MGVIPVTFEKTALRYKPCHPTAFARMQMDVPTSRILSVIAWWIFATTVVWVISHAFF